MKFSCLLLLSMALCSCNTTIGVGRDIKVGFIWAKNKIQEKRHQSQQTEQDSYEDDSGAPVY